MHRSAHPRIRRRAAAFLLAVGALLIVTSAPADAHTVGGVAASNYRTRVTSVQDPIPGVTVRPVDNGNRLELRNTGSRDVVVIGYDDEPYLRVGPRGVFENRRSPATYLNRSRTDPAPPPASADPTAPPVWHRISGGDTVRWHDHRAHWMGTTDPPVVRRSPGTPHLIQRFRIEVRRNDRVEVVRGDVRWIPGPSPWPWLAGAAVVAVGIVLGARTRRADVVIGTALALALVGVVVHAVGAWTDATNPIGSRLADAIPTLAAVALGGAALERLVRRGLRAAAPLLVFAGLLVGIAIGLADLSALRRSQVPTDLPLALDRATIALALGGGAGVTVGAALHVAERRPPAGPGPGPEPGQE